VSITSAPAPARMWRTRPLSVSSDQIVPVDHSLAILCPFREEKNPAISRLGASFPDLEPTSTLDALANGGFEICIDGLSFWLMRIAREIGRGTSVQALWE
jgi:hypothetical protein